ncbi:MAG: GGDEF domain-containing protein [Xanthomonadales bacterium]|nr:GGDEF domain-containing protein [Xanthomonadales bacterium]MCB1594642.1 GGDEF domain-containing protein [Xanthomonadales bacterium]
MNVFLLVIATTVALFILNYFFYKTNNNIQYFEVLANSILIATTFYLIYITQRNSTNKSGFYYYTSIGFAFLYFALLILTLDHIYEYNKDVVKIAVKLLFVFGYSLLAIGVSKWVRYNEMRQGELAVQASTDELTGILNRRSFTSFIKLEFINAKKNFSPFSLAIIDIDYFKQVNDEYGHLVGDEILIDLANLMKSSFRSTDKVCRWGGEEFAILLPGTSLPNAVSAIDHFRQKIENHEYQSSSNTIKYTISAGVSESLTIDKNIDDLIKRADEALYKAKSSNRNCVRSARS